MLSIYEKAKRGLPLDDVLVIDCHDHLGFCSEFHGPKETPEAMLASMDRLGIDIVCTAAHASIWPNYIYGNNQVIEALRKYPDRFSGYATVNPNYPDDMKHELGRCFSVSGMRGIKLHPGYHGCAVDYKNYNTAYEAADEMQLPVLIHVWGKADVNAVDRLAARYSGARLIMGHAGGPDVKVIETALDVVNRHDNVYVDLALSYAYEGNVEWMVSEVGSKKVLFGSDLPYYDAQHTFGRIAMAEISDDEKRDIFGLNMKELLKL